MTENPVAKLLREGLSEFDFGIVRHGFEDHGRDYTFLIQDGLCGEPGTYELTFTHVVFLKSETRVCDDAWLRPWGGDEFTHYSAWLAAGEPQGFIFGTNWSLAYPGISAPAANPDAEAWAKRLGRPMHAVEIETERFLIFLVFADAKLKTISADLSTIRQTIVPLD